MNVTLIRDGNPDAMLAKVWTAIKTCKSDRTPTDLYYEALRKSNHEMTGLLKGCYKMGHLSVFEHVSLSYMVSGVSRALLAQLSRHRIGISLSVQSQRYVKMMDFDPIVPPAIAMEDSKRVKFDDAMLAIIGAYEELMDLGVRTEDARSILPNCTPTNMMLTVNLRSLDDLYQKRVVARGVQQEIRDLVKVMVHEAIDYLPWWGDVVRDIDNKGGATDM